MTIPPDFYDAELILVEASFVLPGSRFRPRCETKRLPGPPRCAGQKDGRLDLGKEWKGIRHQLGTLLCLGEYELRGQVE